jgi:flagellar biosynthesis/type III secretory pathway M-ring protein FliF/YscJ
VHYVTALLARWNSLSKSVRRGLASASALLVACSMLAAFLAHPSRSALFATPLHPEQLSEVEERLAGWNVPFTPSADNVIIETSRRDDLLLRLSLAGIPHSHVQTTGEALSAVGVLTPQAVIDAQTRVGLAGDLESGLRGIDGIDDARVIVAPAKLAEFADESSREATASVRLRLRPGVRLSRATVNGIRQFVAAGVTGLDPARVTIVDDRGIALGDADDGEEASDLQTSLQSALDAAFGEGVTIVRVHAEFGTEEVNARELRRSALGAPIAVAMRSERYTDGNKRYEHADRDDDRGTELREIVTQAHPGDVKRISTAVFLDESRAIDLPKVRDLAAATVGYDERRGDALVVQAVDFRHALTARKDPWWLLYGLLVPLVPALVTAIAAITVARMALPHAAALLQRALERSAVRATSKAISGLAPSRVRSVLAEEPPHAAAAIISALPAATAAAVLDLYPAHEREAIVRRMQRSHGTIIGDPQEYLRRHA